MSDSAVSWVEFEYREFYDVPRLIIVRFSRSYLLLESLFDDNLDDYEDSYKIYRLSSDLDISGSWEHLAKAAMEKLGAVPVSDVTFDSTRRQRINLENIQHLIPSDMR